MKYSDFIKKNQSKTYACLCECRLRFKSKHVNGVAIVNGDEDFRVSVAVDVGDRSSADGLQRSLVGDRHEVVREVRRCFWDRLEVVGSAIISASHQNVWFVELTANNLQNLLRNR